MNFDVSVNIVSTQLSLTNIDRKGKGADSCVVSLVPSSVGESREKGTLAVASCETTRQSQELGARRDLLGPS